MPVYRTPRRGVSYSQAIAEAYASAPDTAVLLDTLEFRHPLIVGSAFVVNDHEALDAYLEPDAPVMPGAEVTFLPVQFTLVRAAEDEASAAKEVSITVDNVARILVPYLDAVKTSRELLEVTWRAYLASDLTAPHISPPLTLTVTNVQVDMSRVTVRAGFSDLTNRRYPGRDYTSRLFPGLTAR